MFDALPAEILQLIFTRFCLRCREFNNLLAVPVAHFRDPQQQQHPNEPSWHSMDCHALFMLCLVSKCFCSIAQPILYHEFVPGYGNSWRSASYSLWGRLVFFLRFMAERRDLAALVKRIYIHPFLFNFIDGEGAQDAFYAARAFGVEEIEEWPQKLGAGDVLAVLIAALSELEHLQPSGSRIPTSRQGTSLVNSTRCWGFSTAPRDH